MFTMPSSKSPATRASRRSLFQTIVNDLHDERDQLSRRLAEIEEELAEYGVTAAASAEPARPAPITKGKPAGVKRTKSTSTKGKRTPRSTNPGSLKNCILGVLGAEGMRVPDIARAVLKGGYKTKAVSLDKSVAVACGDLIKAKTVKRTGRGLYAATRVKS